ncbi:MAG: hypothetical protein MSA65_03410 [Mollicutes bacterium]|nr:hypothetical protein [Mollicutes bacterium]
MKKKDIKKYSRRIAQLERQKKMGKNSKLIEHEIYNIVGEISQKYPEQDMLTILLAIDAEIMDKKLC